MKIAIVGVGLIGGSLAISLRENGFASGIVGVEANIQNGQKAVSLGLVDNILPLSAAIKWADLIIVATPVGTSLGLIPSILDNIEGHQIIMDVGSTKTPLIEAIENHKNRKQFVGTHPMAGTEFSGPEAAIKGLFYDKVCVICDAEHSEPKALKQVLDLYASLNMKMVYLNGKEHDIHTAYISHISHLSSFALALTVLEKEKDENKIFELASSGFSSTVRLAKSSADTWVPIFEQNRENVLDVLDEHIHVLNQFRTLLQKRKYEEFHKLITQANDIKRILKQ
jgi:prephenate dehydrogenase